MRLLPNKKLDEIVHNISASCQKLNTVWKKFAYLQKRVLIRREKKTFVIY